MVSLETTPDHKRCYAFYHDTLFQDLLKFVSKLLHVGGNRKGVWLMLRSWSLVMRCVGNNCTVVHAGCGCLVAHGDSTLREEGM